MKEIFDQLDNYVIRIYKDGDFWLGPFFDERPVEIKLINTYLEISMMADISHKLSYCEYPGELSKLIPAIRQYLNLPYKQDDKPWIADEDSPLMKFLKEQRVVICCIPISRIQDITISYNNKIPYELSIDNFKFILKEKKNGKINKSEETSS